MHEPLKPLVSSILTRKSSGNRLSHHGVDIPGSQTYMGAAERKQTHSLLHRGSAASERGRVALHLALIIVLQKHLEFAYVMCTIKSSPWPVVLLLNMSL